MKAGSTKQLDSILFLRQCYISHESDGVGGTWSQISRIKSRSVYHYTTETQKSIAWKLIYNNNNNINLLFIHTLLNLNRNSKVRAVWSLQTFSTPISWHDPIHTLLGAKSVIVSKFLTEGNFLWSQLVSNSVGPSFCKHIGNRLARRAMLSIFILFKFVYSNFNSRLLHPTQQQFPQDRECRHSRRWRVHLHCTEQRRDVSEPSPIRSSRLHGCLLV